MTRARDWPDRITAIAAHTLQVAILVPVVGAGISGNWKVAFTGVVVLLLTFLPSLTERRLRVHLPVEFTFVLCLFLYASFILGELGDFYERFWWWDQLLHTLSALVTGLLGFLAIYVFYASDRVQASPAFVAILSFCVAVAAGTVWEVFEFGMDWFFGLNMQKSGLVDTMTDMLVNMFGALVAAVAGYAYIKDGDSLIADRIIRAFVKDNPSLFSDE